MPEVTFSFSPGFWMLGLLWRCQTVHAMSMDGKWTINGPNYLKSKIRTGSHRELTVVVCLVPMLPVRLAWRWAVPSEVTATTGVPDA